MTQTRRRLGQAAEDLVAARLADAHWEIVERNARTRYGELDIVALDGGTLVFVEVKAGRAGARHGPQHPLLAIGPRKQRRIRRLATAWMAERRNLPRYEQIRLDAVGVTYNHSGRVTEYVHLEGAF